MAEMWDAIKGLVNSMFAGVARGWDGTFEERSSELLRLLLTRIIH